MRRLVAVLVLATLALTAAACADDAGDGVAPADAPFCDAYGELLSGPLADEETDVADPAVLEAAVDRTNQLLTALIDAAPDDEIGGDAMALTADYQRTFAVLEEHGYDLGRVGTEATAEEQATLDDFGAGDRGPFDAIGDWVADRCAPDVTIPADLLGSTTTATTSP